MAPSTAYALRRRAVGASFALAWDAARLLGRERLGDALHARAMEGVTETIVRPDGSTVTRHRFDTRLATMMLRRADRHAEGLDGAHGQAARLVAAEFAAFLDLLARGEGPARAGLFLGTRLGEDAEALAPVVALARADTWLRTGAARGGEVDVADLDPAQRAHWSAEQWLRAEAAGLLAIAAPPAPEAETLSTSPLSPLSPLSPDDGDDSDPPVWWCVEDDAWRTRFPPPDGFADPQEGEYGEPHYSRPLSAEEAQVVASAEAVRMAPVRVAGARERDAWFAALANMGLSVADAVDAQAGAADAGARSAPDLPNGAIAPI